MSNFFIAIIRTFVPIAVGAVVGWLASVGLELDPEVQAQAVLGISTLAASLYYLGVAALAAKVPAFGWLLGVARNPVYTLPSAKTPSE
ncbi:hypothetical protein [Cryobacterium sp. PH31-O1]|uniref:hypothetical protein n=1 Tax=Cryobacterium sp. PH31-O1 TaxID=3046306 RepID=UPI0024B9A93C|nr:hypothetical protein [Cryobacterium sp. PH31-O1]MDJ0338276.1 hypothetical protein [Cryobacterium sp. PH31-O1]